MARNRRRRASQNSLARDYYPSPLDHTARRSRVKSVPFDDVEPVSLAEIREAFSRPTVRPLIRTVLVEPETFSAPPRRGKRQSPTLAVRATIRSTDRRTRSPYLNATMVTPQLTERALECAKRSIRREVIFATRKTGKGARSPRRTPSKVKC